MSKRFAGVEALRAVSLTLRRGEIRCLVGENGCGKSTLAKIIAGVHVPDSGELWIDGVRHRRLRPIDAVRAGVQVIYQDFSLFPNLTVAENIALGARLATGRRFVGWREMRRVAARALGRLDVEVDPRREVGELSVAGKQLVSIARALVEGARLIIMDEPTTALTRTEVDILFQIVLQLKQQGVSVLFVSHKLGEVLEISEQITVLRNGEKVAEGPTSDFDSRKLTYHMTGREFAESGYRYSPRSSTGESALSVEGLCDRGRFQDVIFRVRPGEILGLSGLLGSGRTDLAEALFGLRPADSGRVSIGDRTVRIRDVSDAIRHGIAYVPEDRLSEGLFLEQSIERNLVVGILPRLSNRVGFIDGGAARATTERWLSTFKVKAGSAADPVQSLSGGNQQKIVLARWLATDAKVLILNGPTVGVDVGSKMDIHDEIKRLAKEGLAVILISDDIPELLSVSNRILLMHNGRLVDDLETSGCDESSLTARLSELR